MEHRKEYGSPRDILDDALLQRVLSEMANDDSRKCGERTGCGCQHAERNNVPQRVPEHHACGCRDTGSMSRPERQPCSCSRNRNQIQPRQEIQQNETCCYQEDSCISGKGVPTLQGLSLAMVYSPNQAWEGILEPEDALARGTLFSGLLFPWYPSRCHESRDCGCGRD